MRAGAEGPGGAAGARGRRGLLGSSAVSDAIPATLGPYRVVRRIGRGGMAEVFLAVRYGASGFEKQVAVKVLRSEHHGRAEIERLLIAEAKIGARFSHPGLVHVHDLGLHAGAYYVVMDFVDGADLAALLGRRALPLPLALWLAEQVALALAYVHALRDELGRPLGLVHRDVSPGNVLVSRTGDVKLADFGIAKATALRDITWGRMLKGKFAYMSPEQVAGEAVTPASDQFALGIALYELLLGARPFDGPGPLPTMDNIRRAELPDDPELLSLPPPLPTVLRRCLAREPGGRYADLAAVARELQAARLHLPPVGPIELGRWVSEVLAGSGPALQASPPATAGLDTQG